MKFTFLKNLAAAALIAMVFCGCVSKVNLAEVLQQPQDAAVRTRYHLWYTDAAKVSPLNIMQGSFIPAGTAIEPVAIERGTYDMWGSVSVTDGSIKFRTLPDNKEFTIVYDERLTMMPIEEFLRNYFTADPKLNVYAQVPANELERVKAGRIELKMHDSSVLVVLGPPAKSRTSQITNQSWLYWKSPDVVFRLIFRKNVIRHIGSLDGLDF